MSFQSNFLRFHQEILLTDQDHYTIAREARDHILSRFRRSEPNDEPWTTFQHHNWGSYAMGTGVRPLPGKDYDIDLGLVFNTRPIVDARRLKSMVFSTLQNAGYAPKWMKPCLSIKLPGFHIDMSVCCRESESRLYLAEGRQDEVVRWRPDGHEWFVRTINAHHPYDPQQFKRVIRYLKRWKDIHFSADGMKGPVGLALTVMAYKWYAPQSDDLSALQTVVRLALRHFQQGNTSLLFPYEPNDNLLRKLSWDQVGQMQSRFEQLDRWLSQAAGYEGLSALQRAFGSDFR